MRIRFILISSPRIIPRPTGFNVGLLIASPGVEHKKSQRPFAIRTAKATGFPLLFPSRETAWGFPLGSWTVRSLEEPL